MPGADIQVRICGGNSDSTETLDLAQLSMGMTVGSRVRGVRRAPQASLSRNRPPKPRLTMISRALSLRGYSSVYGYSASYHER